MAVITMHIPPVACCCTAARQDSEQTQLFGNAQVYRDNCAWMQEMLCQKWRYDTLLFCLHAMFACTGAPPALSGEALRRAEAEKARRREVEEAAKAKEAEEQRKRSEEVRALALGPTHQVSYIYVIWHSDSGME